MNFKKIHILIFIIIVYISCKDKNEFIKTPIVLSKIDSLKTKEEIEKFIQEKDTNFKDFELKSILELKPYHKMDSLNILLAKKLKINSSFEKVDIDNNGFTDIIATGGYNKSEFDFLNYYKLLVMNFPKNKYKINKKYLDFGKTDVIKVEYINNKTFLVIYNYNWKEQKYFLNKSILTYKFNNLIEYNKNPKLNIISKIEYISGPCLGTCPYYGLNLNRDSTSVFKAIAYNFNKNKEYLNEEGTFVINLDKNRFNKLEEVLNYIDFENLKEEYTTYGTDAPSADLKITFINGKVKKISDYGMVGTYGLKMLYKEFDSLRFNQKWRRIK